MSLNIFNLKIGEILNTDKFDYVCKSVFNDDIYERINGKSYRKNEYRNFI